MARRSCSKLSGGGSIELSDGTRRHDSVLCHTWAARWPNKTRLKRIEGVNEDENEVSESVAMRQLRQGQRTESDRSDARRRSMLSPVVWSEGRTGRNGRSAYRQQHQRRWRTKRKEGSERGSIQRHEWPERNTIKQNQGGVECISWVLMQSHRRRPL